MTGRRPGLVALPLGLVVAGLLAGCAGGGRVDVRDGVEAVTAAADARDADGVRDAVDDLLAVLDRTVSAGELSSSEAARIAAAAREVRDSADLVDDDVIEEERERAEAERKGQEEAARTAQEEAARRAQEEADRRAQEEADRKAAEDAKQAEEEARKAAEEEAKQAEEDAKKDEEKGEGKDGDGDG